MVMVPSSVPMVAFFFAFIVSSFDPLSPPITILPSFVFRDTLSFFDSMDFAMVMLPLPPILATTSPFPAEILPFNAMSPAPCTSKRTSRLAVSEVVCRVFPPLSPSSTMSGKAPIYTPLETGFSTRTRISLPAFKSPPR